MAHRLTHAPHPADARALALSVGALSVGALSVGIALALTAPSAEARAASAVPRVHLAGGIPTLLTAGTRLDLHGSVTHAGSGTSMRLEARRADKGAHWRVVARAHVHAGRFSLSWLPPAGSQFDLRLSLERSPHLLARSSTVTVRTGQAPRYCAPVGPPPSVPAGDGWVTGGVYLSGGPAPGIFACSASPAQVEVLDEQGNPLATAAFDGSHDFTLALPPGSYALKTSSGCETEEPVTVKAGMGVDAEVVCSIS